jgi:hypothetical protein
LPVRAPVPYLPGQPWYHTRLLAAAALLAQAISHLATVSLSWCDSLRLLDATPVPLGWVHESTIGFPPDRRQPYPAQADYARQQMPDHRTGGSVVVQPVKRLKGR